MSRSQIRFLRQEGISFEGSRRSKHVIRSSPLLCRLPEIVDTQFFIVLFHLTYQLVCMVQNPILRRMPDRPARDFWQLRRFRR